MALTQKAERAALNKLIDYLDENPEEHIPQIMELIDKLVPASVFPAAHGHLERHSRSQQLV